MKPIPLNTKFIYLCSEHGEIFRNGVKLKGWTHESKWKKKYYKRYGLVMENGKRKLFFAQRLVAFTYHNLSDDPKKIVRHLTPDSFNNHKDSIAVGTQKENQTVDRIKDGNYMNRGAIKQMDAHLNSI